MNLNSLASNKHTNIYTNVQIRLDRQDEYVVICIDFFSNFLETPAERLLLNGSRKKLEVET